MYKKLVSDLTEQYKENIKKEDWSLHTDIKKQYLDVVKEEISIDLGKELGIDAMEIKSILESFDIEQYINL